MFRVSNLIVPPTGRGWLSCVSIVLPGNELSRATTFLKMSTACIFLLGFLMVSGGGHASEDIAASLDTDGISWQRAVFRARKFFLTAQFQVKLDIEPSATVLDELLSIDAGVPVNPAKEVVRLNYSADTLGRHTDTTLLLRPKTAAAIQYDTYEPGKRRRIYRFFDQGTFKKTWRPAEGEESYLPTMWSDISQDFRPYPKPPGQETVIDPLGLLYVVAAVATEEQFSELDLLAYDSNHLSRIVLEADGMHTVKVDFSIANGAERLQCKGELAALRIRINALPFEADAEAQFDFLGMQSDLSILIEPATRLPLQISGRAKIVGELIIKLREATISSGKCPQLNS